MKKAILICILCCLSLQVFAQSLLQYKQIFWQQMFESCHDGLRFEKSVIDLANGGKVQTKVFELDCNKAIMVTGGKSQPMNSQEFEHLFQYAFDNPKLKDYLDVQRNGQSVIATAKPANKGDTELQLQRFEFEGGKMKLAEVQILKNTPLYDLEIRIKVNFDGQGHYLSHHIANKTVVLFGSTVDSKIEGRLIQ